MNARPGIPLLALACCAAAPCAAAGDPRATILDAMTAELARTKEKLSLPGHPPPYFSSFTVKELDSVQVSASFGAVNRSERRRARYLSGDVRVGDYRSDSSTGTGHDAGEGYFGGYRDRALAPLDDDAVALRAELWSLADQLYKSALTAFFRKKARAAEKVDEADRPDDHSHEAPSTHMGPPASFPVDLAAGERLVRTLSAAARRHPRVFDPQAELSGRRVRRYFVSSEGARIATDQTMWALRVSARTRADDGMLLSNFRDFHAQAAADLPAEKALTAACHEMLSELDALRAAPVMDPYSGPALLESEVAGVLFHEVVGHRLEGERQREEREGQTFKDKVGEEILPAFLSLSDDPTQRSHAAVPLAGAYAFDDEGVSAQRAVLVENGVLRGFLLSRTPIRGFPRSNGHGRASLWEDPMGRMANLIVRTSQAVPRAALQERLREECRRQGKTHGLLFRHMESGETNTSRSGFQAFRGTPILVFRVHAADGRVELVRGVEIVGTPLLTLRKVVAAGDDVGVFNGYCGAESGFLPVSAVAPSVLISELEVQRVRTEPRRPHILPPPYAARGADDP